MEGHRHSEINALGYPKAALFGCCLALVAFNLLRGSQGGAASDASEKSSWPQKAMAPAHSIPRPSSCDRQAPQRDSSKGCGRQGRLTHLKRVGEPYLTFSIWSGTPPNRCRNGACSSRLVEGAVFYYPCWIPVGDPQSPKRQLGPSVWRERG